MGKNKRVAGILYTISAAQFGVGVYMFVWAALKPGEHFRPITYVRALELIKGFTVTGMPVIPLDPYQTCPVTIQQAFAVIQMSLSLTFG